MILKRMHVTHFRSVEDSGWVEIDKVTALIGVNESGKSNLLLPLWKFNPAQEGELQATSDYPKKLFGDIRAAPEKYTFISVEFDIGELASEVARLTGFSLDEVRTAQVSRNFAGGYAVKFPNATPPTGVPSTQVATLMEKAASTLESATPLKSEEATSTRLISTLREIAQGLSMENVSRANLSDLIARLSTEMPKENTKSRVTPLYVNLLEDLGEILERMNKAPIGRH